MPQSVSPTFEQDSPAWNRELTKLFFFFFCSKAKCQINKDLMKSKAAANTITIVLGITDDLAMAENTQEGIMRVGGL